MPVLISVIEDRPADLQRIDPAVVALCQIGAAGKEGIPAIRRLVKGVKEREPGTSRYSGTRAFEFISSLPKLGSDGIALLVDFLMDKDADLQSKSAEVLGDAGAAAKIAIPALKKLLNHQAPEVRLNAAIALWKIDQNPSVVPVLAGLLKEEKGTVTWSAAYALSEIGPAAKAALPELVKAFSRPQLNASDALLNAIQKIDPAEAQILKQNRPAPTAASGFIR